MLKYGTVDYQKAYVDKVGSAKLNIKKAVAGSTINCRLTYEVGKVGIDDSGSLKVLFRIVTDAANPQFDNPKAPNFVKLSASRKDIKISVGGSSGGMYGKVHERPWSKGFVLNFSGDFLEEGDEIYIDFKKWRVQTFYEETFEFRLVVDPFASGRFVKVPHCPEMEIVPDKPEKLKVVAPTLVEVGKPFKFLIKLEDKWSNPCINLDGEFAIAQNNDLESLPHKVKFKKGRAEVTARSKEVSTAFIAASYDKLKAFSNPVKSVRNPEKRQFWADLHGQSEETVGTNDLNYYFSFARDYSLLDVCAPQHNDFQVTSDFWEKINNLSEKFTKEGEFVVFPGYEWSGNTSKGGDRNVLYLEEGEKIFRSSHALLEDFSDLAEDTSSAKELFGKLKGKKAMSVPHVGGRYSELSVHDKKLERNIEIHSDWGTFEWFLFDALRRGYKLGIVANSDNHTGKPGASYPSFAHFNNIGGLTCILAKKLDRKSIFTALYNRHCYATTGARIYLDVGCFLEGMKIAGMGDEIRTKGKPTLKVKYVGNSSLDRIEIVNRDLNLESFYPEIKKEKGKTLKIVWSGSKVKGRKRAFSWEGEIMVDKNKIKDFEKLNFYNQENFVNKSANTLNFKGMTTGGLQGVILNLAKNEGNLNLSINDKKISLPIKHINQIPHDFDMGGLDAKVEIYQTTPDNKPSEVEFDYELDKLAKGVNPIFVKVTQKDGHLAWSSPIYITN